MEHVTFKTDDELARKEAPIEAESLLCELLPLMEEYFIGKISLEEKDLLYRMPNGQKFKITVQKT